MISAVTRENNWRVRGPLLATMVFTLPVFFYLFVVGGIVTCGWLLTGLLPALLFPFNIYLVVYGIHLLVFGWPMYWLSGVLARWICRYEERQRLIILGIVCAVMIIIGALPIFGAGHEAKLDMNAFEILVHPKMRLTP